MRKLPFFSIILLCILISCSKKITSSETSNTLTRKTKILVKHTWFVEEVMSNVHGLNLHYIKDSFNNTGEDYSIYRFTFKSDGTGTYIDGAGNTHTTAWKFTSPDGHNMEFTLTSPNSSTYIWNMVEISEKSFQTITALTIDNNNNILQSTRCVPMKP